MVSAFSSVTCNNESYFKSPENYLPERWLRKKEASLNAHPYGSLPFGHGPRMCPGRSLAMAEMTIALASVSSYSYIKYIRFDEMIFQTPFSSPLMLDNNKVSLSYCFGIMDKIPPLCTFFLFLIQILL